MKIGIVTTWFERGAAYVSKQFEDVLAKEHEVFIYARGGEASAKGDPQWDKANVTWGKEIGSPVNSTVIEKKDFLNWIKTNNIQRIIFNEQRWFFPLLWCKELHIPTFAYIDYYTEKTIPLFEAFDYLICNTKKHFEVFKWHTGARYIPWGTDTDLFKPKTDKGDLVNSQLITIFHSAGMSPFRKGTDQLLRAFNKARTKDVRLVIHTQVELIKEFPELKSIIEEMCATNKLEIVTRTITAPGLYCVGDVYIYPARLDGLGLTMAEAISSGLTLIVPDNGPMNEFCDPTFGTKIKVDKKFARSDGYYWPQCEIDIIHLTRIIENLENSKENIIDKKKLARKYALKYLDWKKNSKILFTVVKLPQNRQTASKNEILKKIEKFENSGSNKLNKLYLRFYPFSKYVLKRLK